MGARVGKPVQSMVMLQAVIRKTFGLLAIIFVLSLASGCTRHVFMTEKVFEDAASQLSYQMESNPTAGVTPITNPVEAPATVDFPERSPRYMTLPEVIAIALENGNTSGPQGQGLVDDTFVGVGRGPLNNQSQRVRVLAMNPAINETNIEASLARFDPKWITNMTWSVIDNFVNGLADFQNGNNAVGNTTLVKPLASGGVANITFGALNPGPFTASYTNLRNPPNGVINNMYNMPVTFGIEQPLWQNFGVGINQLLNQIAPIQGITMPGQATAYINNIARLQLQQGPNFAGLATQGILLARLNFDMARAEFEAQINHLLQNVEVAYWRLYQSYGQLYSWDEALKTALTGWRFTKSKTQQELEGTGAQELFLTQALYEEFRGERLKALGQVLEAERHLRGIMGLPAEDGMRIVPITAPTTAPYRPNWQAAVDDALAMRPELIMARENLRNLQFNLQIAKNFLKPDIRAVGFYQPVGWGTRLDGNGTVNEIINGTSIKKTSNALRSLADGNFVNWQVGLTMNIPLGWRLENAAVRSARLQLAQAYYVLLDQEQKAERALTQQFQKVAEYYDRIQIARSERKAYEETVKAYWKLIETQFGKQFSPGNQAVVDAERRLALARLKEYEAIAEYNASLCRLEWSKGTIQQYDNVVIAEGALPQIVETRAVEHERLRTQGIVIQERQRGPGPVAQPGMLFIEGPGAVATPPAAPAGNGNPQPKGKDAEAIPLPPRELKAPANAAVPAKKTKTEKSGSKVDVAPKTDPMPKSGMSPQGATTPQSTGTSTRGTIIIPDSAFQGLRSIPQRHSQFGTGGVPAPARPPAIAPDVIGPPPPLDRR